MLGPIDFFIYSRAAPGAGDTDDGALDEEHWSYIDRFADGMVARGPTLGPDRETWTGSIHIVDLLDAAAAQEFVAHEPYNRAGLYAEHLIRRFENRLGRTMWDYPRAPDEPRFFVIADDPVEVPTDWVIVHGDLLAPDDGAPVGVALALQAPARDDVAELVGRHAEVLDWQFGGRR
jgi:hypothetical protein